MKKIIGLLLFVTSISLGSAQAIHDYNDTTAAPPNQSASDGNDRIVRGETRQVSSETTDWVKYDEKTHETVLNGQRIHGRIHRIQLADAQSVNNYDYRTGQAHPQRLAVGTWVWMDEAGNLIAKCSCKNPLSTPVSVTAKGTDRYYQRETKTVLETDIHHYHTNTVTIPGPTEYRDRCFPIIVMAPQQQYIANLGAPTVVAPQAGGFAFSGGTSIKVNSRNNNSAYGAAAAAAAAAASSSSSSTSAVPGAAAGSSGGGGSSGSAGGGSGGSNSGGGSH